MKIVMRVVQGPDVGREFVFPAEGESGDEATNILVGRDDVESQAHWRLSKNDPTVSRAHFILEVRPPNCYVQDNQSVNGVYLRRGNEPERRVQKEVLQDGDQLRLGKTVVAFEIYAPIGTVLYTPEEEWVAPEEGREEAPSGVPPAPPPSEAAAPPPPQEIAAPPPPPPSEAAAPPPPPKEMAAPPRPPEPPDPEFYCLRCGERMKRAPELRPLMEALDFMCPRCRAIVEEERRRAEERSQTRYFCVECGKDLTDMARNDGRAEELKDVALYLCPSCGNRARQQQQILGYWVLRRLGAGGMGEVYKVWHPQTGRLAALKKLLPIARADDRSVLRFQREILIMKELVHPNIVRLYEAGQEGSSLVFISEFVPNGDLLQFISDDGQPLLSPPEVVSLLADSLVGLAYFHGKGYVHRDLKPENILLKVENGRRIPKVADLGFARSYERHGGTITRAGEYGGTWMYMPPEQITDFKRARPPVDIYAMGVTAYFLLSGYWPLPDFPTYAQIRSGRVRQLPRTLVQMILQDRRVPLEERRPDLPRRLCQVVNKAIAMRPQDRYQSAEEFRQALLQAL